MGKIHEYEGDALTVRFNSRLCIHSAECVRGLPQVFQPKERPWVYPDAADARKVAEVVHRCPTGALTVEWKDSAARPQEDHPLPHPPRAVLQADGPIFLRGDIRLKNAAGDVFADENRLALCRCGASKNKPFCDGSHSDVPFEAAATIAEHKLQDLPQDPACLEGTVAANGPVVLKGPLEIVEGDGTVAFRGQRCALCRCGASKNKPFCDGSHVAAGFEAP